MPKGKNKKGSKKSSSTAKHTENYKNQPASEKDIRKELEAIKINFTEDEIDFTLNEIIEKISNMIGKEYLIELREKYKEKDISIEKTENIILNNICLTFKDALLSLKEKYNEILTLEQKQSIHKILSDLRKLESTIRKKIDAHKTKDNQDNRVTSQSEATNKIKKNENEKILLDFINKIEANRIEVELNKRIDTILKTIEEIKKQQITDNNNISEHFKPFLKYIDDLENNKEYDLVAEHKKKIKLIRSYVTNFISIVEAEIKAKAKILEEQKNKQVDHELNEQLNKILNDISDLISAENIQKIKETNKDLTPLKLEQYLKDDIFAKPHLELTKFESQYLGQLTKDQTTRINNTLIQLKTLEKDSETKIKSINNKNKIELAINKADKEIDKMLADISETISEDKLNSLRVTKIQEDKLKEENEINSIIEKQITKLTNFQNKKRSVKLTEAQNNKIQVMLDKILELSNDTNKRIAELKLDKDLSKLKEEILNNIAEKKINDTRSRSKESDLILREFHIINTIIVTQYKRLDNFERKYGKDTSIEEKEKKDNIYDLNLTKDQKEKIDNIRKEIDKAQEISEKRIDKEINSRLSKISNNINKKQEKKIRNKYINKPKDGEIFIRDHFFKKEYDNLLKLKEQCSTQLSEDLLQNIDKMLTQLKASIDSSDIKIKGYLLDEISAPILKLEQNTTTLFRQETVISAAEKRNINSSCKELSNQLKSFNNSNKQSLTEDEENKIKELNKKLSKIKGYINNENENIPKEKANVELEKDQKTVGIELEEDQKKVGIELEEDQDTVDIFLDKIEQYISDATSLKNISKIQKEGVFKTELEAMFFILHKSVKQRIYDLKQMGSKYHLTQEQRKRILKSQSSLLLIANHLFNKIEKLEEEEASEHTKILNHIQQELDSNHESYNFINQIIIELSTEKRKEFIEYANKIGYSTTRADFLLIEYYYNSIINKLSKFQEINESSLTESEKKVIASLVQYIYSIKNTTERKINILENFDFRYTISYFSLKTIFTLLNKVNDLLFEDFYDIHMKLIEKFKLKYNYKLNHHNVNEIEKLTECVKNIRINKIEDINNKTISNLYKTLNDKILSSAVKSLQDFSDLNVDKKDPEIVFQDYLYKKDSCFTPSVLENLQKFLDLNGNKIYQSALIIQDALNKVNGHLLILEKYKYNFSKDQLKAYNDIIDMTDILNIVLSDLHNFINSYKFIESIESTDNIDYILIYNLLKTLTLKKFEREHRTNSCTQILQSLQNIEQNQESLTEDNKNTISLIKKNISQDQKINELESKIALSIFGNDFAIKKDHKIQDEIDSTINDIFDEISPTLESFRINEKTQGNSQIIIDNKTVPSLLESSCQRLFDLLTNYKEQLTEYQYIYIYNKILELEYIYNDVKGTTIAKEEDISKYQIIPFSQGNEEIVSNFFTGLLNLTEFNDFLSSNLNDIKKNITNIRQHMKEQKYSESEIDELIIKRFLKPNSDFLYNYKIIHSKEISVDHKEVLDSVIHELNVLESEIIQKKLEEQKEEKTLFNNNILDHIVEDIVQHSKKQYNLKKIKSIVREFINQDYSLEEIKGVIITNFLQPKISMLLNLVEENKSKISYDTHLHIIKQINCLEGIKEYLLEYEKHQEKEAELEKIDSILLEQEQKKDITNEITKDNIIHILKEQLNYLDNDIMKSYHYLLNELDQLKKSNESGIKSTIIETNIQKNTNLLIKINKAIDNETYKIKKTLKVLDNIQTNYENEITEKLAKTELYQLPSTELMDFYEKLFMLKEKQVDLENQESIAMNNMYQVFEDLLKMNDIVQDLPLDHADNKNFELQLEKTESLFNKKNTISPTEDFGKNQKEENCTDSSVQVEELNILRKNIEYILNDSHLNTMLKYYQDQNFSNTEIGYRIKFIYQNICVSKIDKLIECYGDNLTEHQSKEIKQYLKTLDSILDLTEDQIYQGTWTKQDSNFNTISPKQNNKNQELPKDKNGKGVNQGSSKNNIREQHLR